MIITKEQFKIIVPHISDKNLNVYLPLLNETMYDNKIVTKERQACFIAQIAHESGSFNTVIENLNYSAKALRAVFGHYFPTDELANEYAHKPEAIANLVYANRMGNGDVESGDGWKHKGYGLIQTTGKDAHRECSLFLFGDERLVDNPELLMIPKNALLSTYWFWNEYKNLNVICDQPDDWKHEYKGRIYNKFEWLTKRINGGLNGYKDRYAFYQRAKEILKTIA